MSRRAYVGVHPSQFKELLRRTTDPARRALLNDRYQKSRAESRGRTGATPRPAHACWRSWPRPRVTRLPQPYRGPSEKARARQRARQRRAGEAGR